MNSLVYVWEKFACELAREAWEIESEPRTALDQTLR